MLPFTYTALILPAAGPALGLFRQQAFLLQLGDRLAVAGLRL
jgi:hypothetical protein